MSADFVDSNIFVYLFDETNPRERPAAEKMVLRALGTGDGAISWQFVQEVLNVLTTKLDPPRARPASTGVWTA